MTTWYHGRIVGKLQIVGAACLCAVGAELLAAYSDSTGNIGAVLFALVFFMGLYGAPALLARELVRRAGWGWPSLLVLFLALAIAQACIIDQSLFDQSLLNDQYDVYEGWAEAHQTTLLPILGISADNAFSFVIGHVIFSFGAPIAVAEAWLPGRAAKPWLGSVGVAFAGAAYFGTALLIALDPQAWSASTPQLVASVVLVGTCLLLAWAMGQHHKPKNVAQQTDAAPRPFTVLAIVLVLAIAGSLFEEEWVGVSFDMATTAIVAALIWWWARQPGWSFQHTAAAGLAFLLSRGALAFTYFPLIGEVDAVPKYAHNAIMMAVVLVAGSFALRHGKLHSETSAPAN